MTVQELIRELQKHDPNAEVHYPLGSEERFVNDTTEIHETYSSTATYGLLRPTPRTVPIVVLATGSEGL